MNDTKSDSASRSSQRVVEPSDRNGLNLQMALDELGADLAGMVADWVDGGLRLHTDWRNGLAGIITSRLKRRLSSHAPESDSGSDFTEIHCPQCEGRSRVVTLHAPASKFRILPEPGFSDENSPSTHCPFLREEIGRFGGLSVSPLPEREEDSAPPAQTRDEVINTDATGQITQP